MKKINIFLLIIALIAITFVFVNCGGKDGSTKLLYQGHASFRLTSKNGTVIYIDPYAGEGYDVPADIILVTHGHRDHNQVQLVPQKKNCLIITNDEAQKGGKYNTIKRKGIKIETVEAYMANHHRSIGVGYIITVDGIKLYHTGDTSETDQMKTLSERNIDYALLYIGGAPYKTAEWAPLIGAKKNIPMHTNEPGVLFKREIAELLNVQNKLIIEPGEEIELTKAEDSKLIVWSFTDELGEMINYYKESHPEVNVEYYQTSSDKFDLALSVGQGIPDIIALESAFIRKYVESGLLLDITDVYEANKSKLLSYPVEAGSYNGKVYGMSWQICPGAMFYRRSLAKKYLGTDDPKTVQTYFNDFNKFLETAKLLKEKSGGSCVLVSALGDLYNSFISARKDPWIVNNRLVIDPVMEQFMDIGKIMRDYRLEGRTGQWSEGWFAGMKGELKDESGKLVEVFSYFLPTWGLHYVLKTNAPETSGDWAMIQGPSSYYWGGTWVGVLKDTKNVAEAKEFIRYVTTDDAFLESWAINTGDIVSNINVINKIKDSYSEPFLGGQNHYAEFAEMTKTVNGKLLLQESDEGIKSYWDEACTVYWNGEKTKSQALADFRGQVENIFRLTK